MRRALGLLAGSLFLAGCTTTVLRVQRDTPLKPLWGDRTLVVADVDEWFRTDAEGAIAGRLPGAVAAHTLPDRPDAADVRSSLLADADDDFGDDWDTVVLVSVEDGLRYDRSLDGDFFDSDDGYARIDFRVSVLRTGDRREVYGMTVRSTAGGAGTGTFRQLAGYAANRAAQELVRTRLFD